VLVEQDRQRIDHGAFLTDAKPCVPNDTQRLAQFALTPSRSGGAI